MGKILKTDKKVFLLIFLQQFYRECEINIRRSLCLAPELLQTGHYIYDGTQKGDSYSFGILLYEIFGRRGPYGLGYTFDSGTIPIYKDIIDKLKNPLMHIRPSINNFKAPDCVRETIMICWQKDPNERPDMRLIRLKLKELQFGL